MNRLVYIFIVLLLPAIKAAATVKLHSLFLDNMVIQRELPIHIFGTADQGESITVTFGNATVHAVADIKGNWSVELPAQEVCMIGQSLVVEGKTKIVLRDILIGDVWLCSGQSNMEMALGSCNDSVAIKEADYSTIRFVRIPYLCKDSPQTDMDVERLAWNICTPYSAGGCSAVGFYFARRVSKEMGVPIGILISSIGGTNIEKWMPQSSFFRNAILSEYYQKIENWMEQYRKDLVTFQAPMKEWMKAVNESLLKHEDIPSIPYVPLHPSMPGSKYGGGQFSHLYNGMISPLYQFKIKGALWYQGENNGEEELTYVEKMKEMIAAWRNGWGYEFPFYIVQLSSWLKPVNDPNDWKKGWQFCRAAQLACVTEIPNTGIAVTYDIGDEEDIHPKNKYDVGERLALWALAHDYGKEISFSGPLYKTITLEEDRIRVNFNYSEDGLMIGRKEGKKEVEEDKIGKLQGFVIAGEDKVWYWADAKIEGNSVIVSSPFVNKPIAVRYAFSMNPRGANLYNRSGLPASPFRSDCW